MNPYKPVAKHQGQDIRLGWFYTVFLKHGYSIQRVEDRLHWVTGPHIHSKLTNSQEPEYQFVAQYLNLEAITTYNATQGGSNGSTR